MEYYYREYKIHTDEGMRDFVKSCEKLFGHYIDTVWDVVCSTTVTKNTRPEIDDTLTERTIYNEGDFIIYPIENKNESYVFHEFTVALSNPNYIPVKRPDYFMKMDSKPCTAIIIYDDSEVISNAKLKSKLEAKKKPKPQTWFEQLIDEFKNTFT